MIRQCPKIRSIGLTARDNTQKAKEPFVWSGSARRSRLTALSQMLEMYSPAVESPCMILGLIIGLKPVNQSTDTINRRFVD